MKRERNGFTLLEMIISMGIMSIVLFVLGSMMYQMVKNNLRAERFSNIELETMVGQKFLTRLLRESTLSYNVLSQPDDTGKNFFDLLNDVPKGDLPTADQSRTLTLSPGGATRIKFIVNAAESTVGRYAPNDAYDEQFSSDGFNLVTGTIAYTGINSKGVMPTSQWANGNMFLFYAPITLRPVPAGGGVPTFGPYRYMAMLGMVSGNDLVSNDFNGAITQTHPVQPATTYSSFDQFFRLVPASAGGIIVINYRRVRLYELYIDAHPETKSQAVWARTWTGSSWSSNPHLVSTLVKSLVLKRPNVSIPYVNFDLEMEKVSQ